jgi:hypothetical protein
VKLSEEVMVLIDDSAKPCRKQCAMKPDRLSELMSDGILISGEVRLVSRHCSLGQGTLHQKDLLVP